MNNTNGHPPTVDPAAEQALIGAVLRAAQTDRDHAVALLEQLPPPGDFYRPQHETLLAHLHAAAANAEPLEPVAIMGRLQDHGDFRQGTLDGPALLDLVDKAAANGQAAYYAVRVRNCANLRRAQSTLSTAAQRLETADPHDLGAVLYDVLADIEDAARTMPDTTTEAPSWRPIDLAPMLDGTYTAPVPAIGHRADGIQLLYPGRHHAVYGESEAGKSWMALIIAAQEIRQRHNVLYLDFEDDPGAIVDRLVKLDTSPDLVRAHFSYISPAEPIDANGNTAILTQAIGDLHPTLGIIDGVTEAMTMHGYDLNDNTDIARFGRNVTGRLAASGAATLSLDHVTKSREGHGRYAIGGQHKLAGLNGAAFFLDNRTPFMRGRVGRSAIYVTKDRPAGLRQHTRLSGPADDRHWFADLVLDPINADYIHGVLEPPHDDNTPAVPTAVMKAVSTFLAHHDRPFSLNEIVAGVHGKKDTITTAINELITLGHITVEPGPRNSKLHTLITPYTGPDTNPQKP